MRIRKFNESIEIENIEDYFSDLIDSGNWVVRSANINRKLNVYLFSPIVQKWFIEKDDPLMNWGVDSVKIEDLYYFIDLRKNQYIYMEIILKCIKHFANSNDLDIIDFRYSSIGTPSTSALWPADTIIFSLK